jgi:hypothetical protein
MNSQTFDNKQAGDRAVASSSWSNWFPGAQVHHLITGEKLSGPLLGLIMMSH